jgi:hypothetical protein
MPGFLIEICTNDKFELPVRVMESSKELADYLGCTEERALNTLWCVRKRGMTFVNRGEGRLKIILVDERGCKDLEDRQRKAKKSQSTNQLFADLAKTGA